MCVIATLSQCDCDFLVDCGYNFYVTPGFRKTNQVHTYMYARIKFHTYSRQK
jgi:hypothetical protein